MVYMNTNITRGAGEFVVTAVSDGELIGDPTEGALVVLAAKGGLDPASTRERYPRIAELPFDAAYKLMATFHAMTDASGSAVIRCYVKGAPDQLLARAGTVFDADAGPMPVDSRARELYLAENQRLGEQGLRVLATGRKDFDPAAFDPGADVRLADPAELHPPEDVADLAKDISGRTGARITITEDPGQAVPGADFIHTDVWVSMGESKDVWTERVRLLAPYQVNADLMQKARNPAVKFMHCLPAFHDTNTVVGREIMEHTGMTSGLEVTDEVFRSPASIVFDQAENRLHTIKAVLVATLG
jgi:Aspartate/ornithine carbamoyltransferase, Asp/Orn binding domain/Cation transport ATPase (P-type)